MEKLIVKLCFGDEQDDSNDVICFVDQVLLGVSKFKGHLAELLDLQFRVLLTQVQMLC